MSEVQIIYKRTATGAVQIWKQEIHPDGDRFRTVSGQIDGEQVPAEWTVCEPKNVGRSNETTPQQQCQFEVTANYTKKLAQGGYHERIEDIDKPKFVSPMLAETFGKKPKKLVTGIAYRAGIIYSQPKLDGMRCVVGFDGMTSRYGKPILSAPHIFDALLPLFKKNPDLVLDGELYADKLAENFQKILSIARRSKNFTPEHYAISQQYLQYHIYDMPSHPGTFSQRFGALNDLFANEIAFNTPGSFYRLVPTVKVRDEDHLNELNESYIEDKLEGQMVRLDNEEYQFKRTWQLQKRKVFITNEYTITGIEPGVGNRSKIAAKVHFRMPSGVESSSSIRGDWDYCKELLDEAEQYIGGDCTIRYVRLTNDGKPYPAVCIATFKGIRDL